MKVATVSYINSYPFVYGLNQFKKDFNLDVILCPPSSCALKAINNEVDFALIPVAALPAVNHNFKIIPQYCIGAERSVSTVLLISNTAIKDIKKIFLDVHSLTSVKLVRLLAAKHWHINPEFIPKDINTITNLNDGEAFLAIGDKCFDLTGKYALSYDLFDEWHSFSGLPFAFAVWIASEKVLASEIEKLNTALLFGISNIEASIHSLMPDLPKEKFKFYHNYLTKNINFIFDKNKEKAVTLFLDLIKFID